MKRIAIWIGLCLVVVTAGAQNKVNPLVKHFGNITEVPFSVENPDPKLDYKIVVEVNSDNPKPETVHEFFDKVAAVVNLHALGGVPASKLHVVMVIHGPAANFVLNDEAYKTKYNTANPNIPLFKELTDAGVKIFVCGQSLNKRNIAKENVAGDVKVALSAITTLTTYQLKGYAMLKY
ncbi:DsrE family protein [Sediminibacterium roseum]|uniref:DsrE family protein n=1 Tax=Sediminibacterium roseum TaxID=1978412 RepID=A0ABW9ZXI5_9BACT|nr:DsrE family protein [Sediminibacterium roseum]NCI49581.1 DsrE family protein [Sediminibacterium roseum]